jgi:hypothetical protein
MDLARLKPAADPETIVAVAVGRVPGPPDSTHAGLLYRDANGGLAALHLGWHHRLLDEYLDEGYVFAYPDIDPIRARQVAELCRLIKDRGPKIPYAFRLDLNARFCAITGDLLTLGDGHGLNCSSFVVVVFQSTGIALIDLAGWEIRSEDVYRQSQLCHLMSSSSRTPESHILAVRHEIGRYPRVRPEETAGACLEDLLPAAYDRCWPKGVAILAFIDDPLRPYD